MWLDAYIVTCPFEPIPQSMDVRYHYGDVLAVVVCSTVVVVVVVELIVSRGFSIVDDVFAV